MFKVEEPRAKSARLAPDLKALAHDLGIETAYLDNTGRRREATHEATLALLRALSVDVETPRDARLMRVELQRKHAERGAPHACVAWAGALDSLTVLRAPGPSVRWKACLKLEDGRTWEREGTLPEQSGSPQEVRLSLGWQLPLGYHELALSVGARTTVTLVIAPPAHAPRCAGRTFGLFAPVYALRGASRQGSGTLRELEELCTWSADRGASFVGTLPIMAQFLDEPCDTSPFAPASRLFWNELVLDLDALHGLEGCEHARTLRHSERFVQALGELEASTHVQARRKVALVHELLEPLAEAFFSGGGEQDPSFCAFVREHPYAREYARFRALVEAHGTPDAWPAGLRAHPLLSETSRPARERMHLFAQWQMHVQLGRVRKSADARGVRLYMDLPVGVHSASFDVFREPTCFVPGMNAGAPPDALCPEGQDWGFAPMHPEGQRAQHYRYLRAFLRTQLTHASMLRIDHVMGLSRVFCVPRGMRAAQGLYLRQPEQELYAVFVLEALRSGSLLVGEDLGTVPDGVRLTMRERGVQRMFVLPFELTASADGKSRARAPSEDSLATLNTHDMPTFQGAWEGLDIHERAARGVLSPKAASAERRDRRMQRAALLSALGLPASAGADAALEASLVHLGESEAAMVQVALEDLWGEREPQNVPGTFAPERNFCRRTARTLPVDGAWPGEVLLARLRRARAKKAPRTARANDGKMREPLPERS